MKWPKEVPMLEAEDIHKGAPNGPHGSHCLYGWCNKVFYRGSNTKAAEVIEELIWKQGSDWIIAYNDNPRRHKKTIARTWNKAMAKLGYVIGNPEA